MEFHTFRAFSLASLGLISRIIIQSLSSFEHNILILLYYVKRNSRKVDFPQSYDSITKQPIRPNKPPISNRNLDSPPFLQTSRNSRILRAF